MAEWGNNGQGQVNVDMIPAAGRHNRLHVVDVDTNDRGLPAIWAVNNNAGGNALALRVDGVSELNGNIFAIGGSLAIEAEVHINEQLFAEAAALVSGGLTCESDTDIDGQLTVGPGNAAGEIDSGGSGPNPQNLRIGTNNITTDVVIGRNGRDTLVRSDLKVGPADDAGLIESGGTTAAPEDLKIGTNGETNGITLGRAGVTADVQCQTRVNSNAVIMNGALAINDANGCGLMFNPDGHPGPLEPCIDFYINGAVVGWVNANGWNNA